MKWFCYVHFLYFLIKYRWNHTNENRFLNAFYPSISMCVFMDFFYHNNIMPWFSTSSGVLFRDTFIFFSAHKSLVKWDNSRTNTKIEDLDLHQIFQLQCQRNKILSVSNSSHHHLELWGYYLAFAICSECEEYWS